MFTCPIAKPRVTCVRVMYTFIRKYIQHSRVCGCEVTVNNRHPRTVQWYWRSGYLTTLYSCDDCQRWTAKNLPLYSYLRVQSYFMQALWVRPSALWLVNHNPTTLSLLPPDLSTNWEYSWIQNLPKCDVTGGIIALLFFQATWPI